MARDDYLNQESPGGLSQFVLTVDDAYFEVDARYSEVVGSDTLFLNWAGRTNLIDRPVLTRSDFHPKWALDSDFISTDQGKTAVSQSGRKQKVGKAYARMCKIAGTATEGLKGTPQDFMDTHDVKDASGWLGTTWFMDNVLYTPGGGGGRVIQPKDELMPVQFIGFGLNPMEVEIAGVTGPTLTSAVTPVTLNQPLAVQAPAVNGGGLAEKVAELARNINDYETFKTAALALEGIRDDGGLVVAIIDNGPTGLYAAGTRLIR